MANDTSSKRARLLEILKEKSVFHGNFTLASGARSSYYIDCRLTTFDAEGACLIGELMLPAIRAKAAELGVNVSASGGLTLGADPIALATAMAAHRAGEAEPLQAFVVRKEPKGHGKGKQVEGGFTSGDTVVVIDDVITTGGSTLKAVDAMKAAGGNVAFVAVLVERGGTGRETIEAAGLPVISLFNQDELLESQAG
ncbi:MAG: orotate phosphoribosyltransferase [Verrucomicrobiales bacterium]